MRLSACLSTSMRLNTQTHLETRPETRFLTDFDVRRASVRRRVTSTRFGQKLRRSGRLQTRRRDGVDERVGQK